MASQCSALHISDQRPCTENASSTNGLFCRFHSRQCFALYRGYKSRNARLDRLVAHPPAYLAEHSTPLANQTFTDVNDEGILGEIHDHLFLRFQLLDRVIRARKLHHSRFFSQGMDYGHQTFLDSLQSQRFVVLKALERLERRTADLLYKKQQWFKWVRTLEDEEEAHRENEKKKIKREAALFQRHQKEVISRMRELRAKEDAKRQAEYLAQAYEARSDEAKAEGESTEEEEAGWDPIEEVLEDERGKYINMIRHFLWDGKAVESTEKSSHTPLDESNDNSHKTPTNGVTAVTSSKKSKKKAKAPEVATVQVKPGAVEIETRAAMRQRLASGMDYANGAGWLLRGTIENPLETMYKTAPLSTEDIDELLEDVVEIKQLLFCRLLLAHAGLLPAALRATSIDEFLQDGSIAETDLRDICLKMEQPGLQELRDACADLGRSDEDDIEDNEDKNGLQVARRSTRVNTGPTICKKVLPNTWRSKREQQIRKHRTQTLNPENNAFVDFGAVDNSGQYNIKKIRVKLCGRYIHNYPLDKAMLRGGWLQFSIIAKGSSLFDAMNLCRNWDEFFEVTVLASWQYFPASNWTDWVGDRKRQQLMQMGLFPYFQNEHADEMSVHNQTGSRSGLRRQHAIFQVRNFVCAHIKRNDPVSRRFVQYVSMSSRDMVLLVRDATDGRIVVKPPEEELWLFREKSGLGRAAKNEWNVLKSVGPKFFQEMEDHRQWHFGFKDHYDLIIWDLEPGQHFSGLYNKIQELLIKAHRFKTGLDFYSLMAPVLKTITREEKTHRVRDIKPSEDVQSLWDSMHGPETRFVTTIVGAGSGARELQPEFLMYNESDAREDEVLFPEEMQEGEMDATVRDQSAQKMIALETEGPLMDRFVYDLDTDEDFTEDEAVDGIHHHDKESHSSSEFSSESERESEGESESEENLLDVLANLDASPDARRMMDIISNGKDNMPETVEKLKLLLKLRQRPSDREGMEDEMDIFMDRQRAAIFKES